MLNKSEIEKLRADLEKKTKEAVEKYGIKKVLYAIDGKVNECRLMQVFATKGGIGKTPDYDKLQTVINILSEIEKDLISKL